MADENEEHKSTHQYFKNSSVRALTALHHIHQARTKFTGPRTQPRMKRW